MHQKAAGLEQAHKALTRLMANSSVLARERVALRIFDDLVQAGCFEALEFREVVESVRRQRAADSEISDIDEARLGFARWRSTASC